MYLSKATFSRYGLVGASLFVIACGADPDLSRAIEGGGERSVSAPGVEARPISWIDVGTVESGNDTLILMPRALCWHKSELLVADGAHQRIQAFDSSGKHLYGFGRQGSGPGKFLRLSLIRCAADGGQVLAVDPGNMTVSFFDPTGIFQGRVEAPTTPHGIPYLGEFAISNDGAWFDSWLSATTGPYLAPEEWEDIQLVRMWHRSGTALKQFGELVSYENPVLRRIFNSASFTMHRDTLWTLSTASATVRGFDIATSAVSEPIFFPVYHRGVEPIVEIKGRLGPLVINRAIYQPNVGGLAIVNDTLFATMRYTNWQMVTVEGRQGGSFKDFWPTSSIDIIDRRGRVLAALQIEGRGLQIAADGQNRLAIITEDFDTGVKTVLITQLEPL